MSSTTAIFESTAVSNRGYNLAAQGAHNITIGDVPYPVPKSRC